MTSSDESALRGYLLGTLDPDEQQAVEERLLRDGDYVELLLALEVEIMDEYQRDELSEIERMKFETHFLTTPERRNSFRVAKAVRQFVDEPKAAPSQVIPIRSSRRSWLVPRAWGWAAAAILLLVVGLGA